MDKLTYRFSLDTHKNGVQRTLQGFETGDTLDRCIEINLTSNGEIVELPTNGVSASLYVKTPNGTLNIDSCTIVGNAIKCTLTSADVSQAGIVECQLKMISTVTEGQVLVAPRFQIEVWESLVSDSQALSSASYTALSAALVNAERAYDGRITDISFDDDYVLSFEYGDGETYETDKIATFLENVQTAAKGDKGDSGTITVGTVTSGTTVSVTNVGTSTDAIFNFTLPKGDKGDTGNSGVYVGTTAPTDSSVKVWIDDDGESDNLITTSMLDGTTIYKGTDGKIHANGGSTLSDAESVSL